MDVAPKKTYARLRLGFTILAIAAAYAQSFVRYQGPWLDPRPVLFLALGLLYLALATWWQSRCEAAGTPRRNTLYFAVQIPLVGVLVSLCPIYGPEIYLLFPLLVQASFMLRPRRAMVAWLILFGVGVAAVGYPCALDMVLRHVWGVSVAFMFVGGCSWLVVREGEARDRAEELAMNLETANARLREQAAQAEELAITRERNRLAREIHDGLGHYLTAIALQAEAAESLIAKAPERAQASVANARSLAQEALTDVRRSVQALRSDDDRPPLGKQLRQLADQARDLNVDVEIAGEIRAVSAAVQHALVRTVQEGLTNVRKHAVADRATVRLDFSRPARVLLEVHDDGRGPQASNRDGFGLNGIRERIEALGGSMSARARDPRGFVLRVEVPA